MKIKNIKKEFHFDEIRINFGLFDFTVFCVIGDYKNLTPYLQWKFDDKDFNTDNFDMGYDCLGKCCFRTGYVPVVWIPKKPKTAEEYGTLAHESFHAVWHLFEWANIPITKDSEEVMAHAISHLVRSILKK